MLYEGHLRRFGSLLVDKHLFLIITILSAIVWLIHLNELQYEISVFWSFNQFNGVKL